MVVKCISSYYRRGTVLLPADQDESDRLEHVLFPWLMKYENLNKLVDSFRHPRGIAISTGNRLMKATVHTVKLMRYFNCTLPIEVFYGGETDLSSQNVARLNSLEGVHAIDATQLFNNSLLQLRGWDFKPFAILGSSFREVLLMDADALFT